MTHSFPAPVHHVIEADATPPQPWKNGGGQTRELLAWPSPADWVLRISRADIAADGPFSAFAGVQRWMVVLQGTGIRLHFDDGTRQLTPGDAPLHFDGALAPGCSLMQGPTQDLNFMLRASQGCMLPVDAGRHWTPQHRIAALYTREAGTWHGGKQTVRLPAHSLLWCELPPPGTEHAPAVWRFEPEHADHPAAPGEPGAPSAWWMGCTPDTALPASPQPSPSPAP